MKLDNVAITATIDGEPVMVFLDKDQIAMLPNLIAACDKTGKCRVIKLDPKEYTLSKPEFKADVDMSKLRENSIIEKVLFL